MLVSIYMPTKNRVEFLSRAVDSVLAQTHRELELWVVDDGSTDGTADYLRRMSGADPRLKFIRNEQSLGAPRARNLAITQACGEFVTGLDDDDCFHERRIETLVKAWQAFEQSGARFSCLFTQDLETNGKDTVVSRKPAQVKYEDLFFYNLIGNQIFTRREYMVQAGLFDELMPAWQDLDMFMRVVDKFGTAMLVDEPLYVLELAPRDDRISVSNARITAAYARLATKVAHQPDVLRQGLFLQRFGRLYGFGLGSDDLREFWRFGVHARTLKRLLGILGRQMLNKRKPRDTRRAVLAIAPLRVLMFPKHSDNPYLQTLSESLERRGARIDDFTYRRAIRERYDVLHIHWPDLHLQARSSWRALAKHARLALLLAVLRARKTHIVWTMHNLKPHEAHHDLATKLFPMWFPRLCTHVIALTMNGLESARELYPSLRSKVSAVIPHGHYRAAYASAPSRESSRAQLGLPSRFTFLFFGNIRPYKNVPLLIEAFKALPREDIQLVIAGQPGRTVDVVELEQLAATDERIRLHAQFVPEERVPLLMGAADVVVLPFDSILNSGSVLLALSFNRTVLAPRMGSLPEIQHRVGARWVNLYDGSLTSQHLSQAFAARGIGEHETTDLSAFDWDSISQQTLDFYRAHEDVLGQPLPAKRVSALPDTR